MVTTCLVCAGPQVVLVIYRLPNQPSVQERGLGFLVLLYSVVNGGSKKISASLHTPTPTPAWGKLGAGQKMGNEETQILILLLTFTGLSSPLRSAVFTLGFISQELRSQRNPHIHTLEAPPDSVPGSKVSCVESGPRRAPEPALFYPQGNQGPREGCW